MSEGEPYKRPKVSEEPVIAMTEESTLKYQNSCLSAKLKEQRELISKLENQVLALKQKTKSHEDYFNVFNQKWAKTVSDLSCLCAELSVGTNGPSPFDVFIQDHQGLESFADVSRKCIEKLLETIRKVSEYEVGSILENCKEHLNMSSIRSENMQLKYENVRFKEEISVLRNEVDELTLKKTNLELRLIKKGDSNIDSSSDKVEDIQEIKNQRDSYKKLYKESMIAQRRTSYAREVSLEPLIKSKIWQDFISDVLRLKKKLKRYQDKYNHLYDYRIKFEDKLEKSCYELEKKESKKRHDLEKEVKKLCKDLESIEKSKNEALQSLEICKNLQTQLKYSNNSSVLISTLESDKVKLKEKNSKLKEKLQIIRKNFESLETSQKTSSSEPETQKVLLMLEDTRSKLKAEQMNSDALIKEIEVTENAYEKMIEKVKVLTKQLADQEELYHKLMSEKVKEASWRLVHDKETAAYESKIKGLAERIVAHEELQVEMEKQGGSDKKVIKDLGEKCKELEKKVKDIFVLHEEGLMRVGELVELRKYYVEALKRAENKCVKIFEEKMKVEEDLKKDVSQLEEKLKARSDMKSVDDSLNKEVAYYKRLITCSVCKNNRKDTILSKCLHVFCKSCLVDHLENRKRKCPLCKNRFSADDMKNFNWER